MAPPIHPANLCAPFRDSGREVDVWMMSCLVRHFHAEVEAKYEPVIVKKFVLSWRSGNLDSKLIPETFAHDFAVADLPINSVSDAPIIPENFEVNEEDEERMRQLISLSRSLKKEQDIMQAHREAFHRQSVNTIASEAQWQQAAQSAVDQAWADHSMYFQVSVSKNLGQAEATDKSAQR